MKKEAFYNCNSLKTIAIKTTGLSVRDSAFLETPAAATVKVPKGKVKAYKTELVKWGKRRRR